MKRPARIEGIALIASTIVRNGRAIHPPISLRKTALMTPRGTLTSIASPTCSKLPPSAPKAPESNDRSRMRRSGDGAPGPAGTAFTAVVWLICSYLRGRAGAGPAHDRRRDGIHDECCDEQRQTGRHQRADGEGTGLTELVGDQRGDGVAAPVENVDAL